jgi:hypothetical protein
MMDARKLMLSVLGGGTLLGVALGAVADPTMVPPPEPTWRKMAPDPIYSEPRQFVEHGPVDLSPNWYMDRMPTWKRRELERSMRAVYEPIAEPAFAAEADDNRPIEVAVRDDREPDGDAAEQLTPVRDAGAPAAQAPRPAIADDEDEGDVDGPAVAPVAPEAPAVAGI